MSTYLEVKNDNNILQVNDELSILSHIAQTSIGQYYVGTKRAGWNCSNPYLSKSTRMDVYLYALPMDQDSAYFIGSTFDSPVYFFMNHGVVGTYESNGSVTSATGKVVVGIAGNGSNNTLGVTRAIADAFKVYKASTALGDINEHGYGMQCYNPSGKVVFDAQKPPIIIKDRFLEQNINSNNVDTMWRSIGEGITFTFTQKTFNYNTAIALNCTNNCFGACQSGYSTSDLTSALPGLQFPFYMLSKKRLTTHSGWHFTGFDSLGYGQAAVAPNLSNWTGYTIIDVSGY